MRYMPTRPEIRQPTSTTVVRFALSGRALPPASETLLWGELARASIMARYGRMNRGAMSPALAGKDASGKPLRNHRHAFYLPVDEDGDGRLDHLTVWTPGGLTAKEFGAMLSVDALNPGDSAQALELAYEGHGAAADFAAASTLFGASRAWRSLTPYVLPRHVKYRGSKGRRRIVDPPEEQIAREVASRFPNGPALATVEVADASAPIPPCVEGRFDGFKPKEFFRWRRSGSNGGGAFNFRLRFAEPVRGPLSLGFACHYGLGMFVPAKAEAIVV